MENNIMRDLTLNEIEEVNGGVWPAAVAWEIAKWAATSAAWEYREQIAQAYADHYRNMYNANGSGIHWYGYA